MSGNVLGAIMTLDEVIERLIVAKLAQAEATKARRFGEQSEYVANKICAEATKEVGDALGELTASLREIADEFKLLGERIDTLDKQVRWLERADDDDVPDSVRDGD